ncbi:MAG: SDR family oxidoreductase [Pseudomonadota bacterium]|nr:SDR family oxidoreductase [Pseudomonadota bacterium]
MSKFMSERLAGKRVVFIGGVTNIGRAAVSLMVSQGAKVVVGDMNEAAGRALVEELGGSVHFVPVDVRDEASVKNLADASAERLGGLDSLCQNAGLLRVGSVGEFASDDWDAVFAVNMRAQFYAVKHVVPHLRAAGGGSIVNMSSVAGKKGGGGRTAYSASKGAVIAFSISLAAELADDNIRVNTVCPGWIDTPFNDPAIEIIGGKEVVEQMVNAGVLLRRQGRPEEVATVFAFLVSDESSYMTAQSIVIDGGYYS